MSQESFEHSFQRAVAESFRSDGASSAFRRQLLEQLEKEQPPQLPSGLTEEIVSDFQEHLSHAVRRSNDWSPSDEIALRVESHLSRELETDCLSERSVGHLLDEKKESEQGGIPSEKLRFLAALRREVLQSTNALKAPAELRSRVESALKAQSPVTEKKVVPFLNRSQWNRRLSALTTVAAGFALAFVTFFGSTDIALAKSVRQDHKNCCQWVLKGEEGSCLPSSALESRFGPIPAPRLDSSWELKLSQVCHGEEGRSMVHMLYTKPAPDGSVLTLSLHFIPDPKRTVRTLELKEREPKEICDDGFPVLGWREGDWICTACSPDLPPSELALQIRKG